MSLLHPSPATGRLARMLARLRQAQAAQVELQERVLLLNQPWLEDLLHWSYDGEQWQLRGAPRGLSLMVACGRLARVEAYRGRWRSSRGVTIGDTDDKVRRRYGRVRSEPHPYVPPGEYLIVGRGRRRMIFETDPGGRVTSFRGGRAREVGYIEGCL